MRSNVIIVQVRVADLQPGDVINKRGPERSGWMEVERVEKLPDGNLVIHDETSRDSFTGTIYDLVWLQTLEELTANSHIAAPVVRSRPA